MNSKPETLFLASVTVFLLLSAGLIFLTAPNILELWSVWFVALGVFIGKIASLWKVRLPFLISGLLSAIIIVWVIFRVLPIHSLPWKNADSIEVSDLHENWKIEITDPQEIAALTSFGENGHYETMSKLGSSYHLYVTHGGTSDGYYLYGNVIASSPGGANSQTVFVPKKDGFADYFENLLKKYGHAKQ